MNTITKKPHFVPAAYLQFWATDGEPRGRKTPIYWCNGKIISRQPVGKVAVQSGVYSSSDPNAAEAYFSEFEGDWADLVRKLISGKSARKSVLGTQLLLQSSYFLLRNPKFSNNSHKERFEIYQSAIEGFWREVIMGGNIPPGRVTEEHIKRVSEVWTCSLLPSQNEPWITSDNPTLLLSIGNSTPAIIFLPITPNWALFATRNDVIQMKKCKITNQDTEYLNSYTTINSIRQIYSNEKFTEQELKSASKWIQRRPPVDNWLGTDEMHFEPFVYPIGDMKLSFL